MGRQAVVGAKSFKHFINVARHGDRNGCGCERDVHAQVGVSFRFDSEFIVVRAKRVDQMVSIVLCAVMDTEIIDYEIEHDVVRFVFEEARGIGTLMISVFLQVGNQAKLAKTTGLR
jgi:hypothetical protein